MCSLQEPGSQEGHDRRCREGEPPIAVKGPLPGLAHLPKRTLYALDAGLLARLGGGWFFHGHDGFCPESERIPRGFGHDIGSRESLPRRSFSSRRPRTKRDCAAATETPVSTAISARSWPSTSCKKSVLAF